MYNVYITNGNTKTQIHYADGSEKVTGKIKQGINTIDTFTFTMLPDNIGYDAIVRCLTLVEVYKADTGALVFRGRALKPTGAMDTSGNANLTWICAGELGYLNDTQQPYKQADGAQDFFVKALAVHNAQVGDDKKIYPGTFSVQTQARSYTWHYVSTWGAIADYIKGYGGEIRLRYGQDGKRYLDYTSTVWSLGSDTKIELAVNMKSVSFTVDPTQVYSGVLAAGAKLHDDGTSAERLELGGVVWNNDLRAQYGDVVACVTWDDVTLASNLQRKAAEWLADQKGELHQYTVSAVDLSKINHDFDEFVVGTQYAIKNPLIGLDDVIRCITKTIDINDPTTSALTFGDRYETMTSLTNARNAYVTSKIDTTADEITQTQAALAQRIVANQTALLTGAEGGYVYEHLNSEGKPQEIFFLDSPSINTATKALRINQNGIGFWDASAQTPPGSAMTGPYKQAWTIDGTFNTDYIVGRQITGFTFDNGDGTFKVQADGTVTAKALTLTNGTINCGNGVFTVSSAGAVSCSNITITNGSINCGNGTFTVSPAGHVVASDIELSGGGSTGGSFTNCYINCGSGTFTVSTTGDVVANSLTSNSATITGGSINIATTSQSDDVIALSYQGYEITLAPEGVWVSDGSYECTLQATGISISHGNDTTIINPTGIITRDAVFDSDISVTSGNNTYWVAAAIADLYDRLSYI